MARKQDHFYFDNFIACAEYAKQAAQLLYDIAANFDPRRAATHLEQLHTIEHAADQKKHELTDALMHAFITPIEREDIAVLSSQIDNLVDSIEEVFIGIYTSNVSTLHPALLPLLDIVRDCTGEVSILLQEFANFRHSRNIKNSIIRINTLEEEADRMYIQNMRRLHAPDTPLRDIVIWRDIFRYLEKCADACEHVADVVEEVIMKNS